MKGFVPVSRHEILFSRDLPRLFNGKTTVQTHRALISFQRMVLYDVNCPVNYSDVEGGHIVLDPGRTRLITIFRVTGS